MTNRHVHPIRGIDRTGHSKSSFSLGQRCGRLFWQICSPLVTWSPRPCHGWRRFVLRCFGARLHSTGVCIPEFAFGIPLD